MSDRAQPPETVTVESSAEFLALVRSSGLVDAAGLAIVEQAVAAEWAAAGPMPETCAARLVASGQLTEWHVRSLLRRATRESFFLDSFKLLRPLGQGGMGKVFLGEITVGDDAARETLRVAIKLLPKKFEGKGQYLNRFLQENWVAARLAHPNIARAWDDVGESTEDCPYHYLVMEYVDGVDLDRKVRKGQPLSVRDAAYFIMSAAKGLHYAHEQGFVHRDIKPANLMVDAKGNLKILDFGLVQEDSNEDVPAALRLDETRKTIGTPDYISPEQAMARRADCRSDIYSLGCTFHFLLTGEAPFDALTGQGGGKSTRIVRMEAHVDRPPPDVRAKRPDTPAVIVELLQRMMEKAPDDRPKTAKEVADALHAFLNGKANPLRFVSPPARNASVATAPAEPVGSQTPAATRIGNASSAGSSIVGGSERSGSGLSLSGVQPSGMGRAVQRDTPQPSSAARSTGRLPAAATGTASPRPQPTAVANNRVQRGPPRDSEGARRTGSTGRPAGTQPASAGSLAGLPLAVWLVVALVGAAGLAVVAALAMR